MVIVRLDDAVYGTRTMKGGCLEAGPDLGYLVLGLGPRCLRHHEIRSNFCLRHSNIRIEWLNAKLFAAVSVGEQGFYSTQV